MNRNYNLRIAVILLIAFVLIGAVFWLFTRTPIPLNRGPVTTTINKDRLPSDQVTPAVRATQDILARPAEVDFFETRLADILTLYKQMRTLEFDVLVDDATLVTYKSQGQTFGDTLTELLATVKCEYTIGTNGQIIIQAKAK